MISDNRTVSQKLPFIDLGSLKEFQAYKNPLNYETKPILSKEYFVGEKDNNFCMF